MLQRLDHIHQRAGTHPDEVFNNLYSLLNHQLLWHAFRRLKRGKAPGVDGVTLDDYEADLRERTLQDLYSSTTSSTAAIDLSPACVRTFRKAMGRRVRWASPAWKTSSFNELSS